MDIITKAIWFFILIGYIFTASESKKYFPPKILHNKGEIIVGANGNLTLECQGSQPVTWTYPNNTMEDNDYWSTVNVFKSDSEASGTSRALLTLHNASYVDTGFYYCHEISASKDDPSKSDSIYVYVRDDNHLALSPEFDVISATQYSTVVLKCLPTSPDVRVTLYDEDDTEINFVSYDPKAGFVLELTSLLMAGTYKCIFTRQDLTQDKLFHIDVKHKSDWIPKPTISAENNGRISLAETLTLNCTIVTEPDILFGMKWLHNGTEIKSDRIAIKNATSTAIANGKLGASLLTIFNVQYEDNGAFKCIVTDHSNNTETANINITVYGIGDSYINLTEEYDMYDHNVTAYTHVVWNVKIDAYPKVELTWFNDRNENLEESHNKHKYDIVKNITKTLLRINDVDYRDAGVYQLRAKNDYEEKSINLTLVVREKPTVEIRGDNYHKFGEESLLNCTAGGYPIPTISWWYKPCQTNDCFYKRISPRNYTIMTIGSAINSVLNLTASETGYVRCDASNNEGTDNSTIGFYLTDLDDETSGFNTWGLDDNSAIAVGDNRSIYCAASVYNYTSKIDWYFCNNTDLRQKINSGNKFDIKRSKTEYSYRISMTINSITKKENGDYCCVVEPISQEYDTTRVVSIVVKDAQIPKIITSNMNGSDVKITLGQPLDLTCNPMGIPAPTIKWRKNDEEWSVGINKGRIRLSDDRKKLSFKYTQQEDEGTYKCIASNRIGSVDRHMQLIIQGKSAWNVTLIVIIIFLIVLFLALLTVFIIKVKKEKKLRRELKIAGLMNFEKGALECLNPELGVDDQAELLPYDKKWEFPRDKLKLGKQLGSGAFGVVMKAEAFGILEGETITTVAVKMVKRNADYTYIKALASELKIMVHLGKHLNVVNLLGACTKNVAKRELLVIVEYCRFGNLHNYLLRHRDDFVNQIDPKTGNIDITIGAEMLTRTLSVGSNQSSSRAGSVACAGVDYRSTPNPSFSTTDSTAVCTPTGGEDSLILSNNSVQPEWRSNYRGDYKGDVRPISTHDLLCWAFQVARGMEYLASRKVLHGDLAARNILLAEENIVKICDFGLAKSMYKSDNYKKKGDGPLPVKWMAVESIRDRVFSTQSDVWSFGIVLWEFFSLARTPYPGMDADERLYNKLVDGYRMDQPEFSTKEIYETMMGCWHAKPTCRPTFTQMAENLGCMLQESVRQHYIELNDPYLIMNVERLGGQNDYLAMLSPPDYGNLSSPTHNYVNGQLCTESPVADEAADSSGYLPMDIFSPRSNDSMFDFEVHKKQKSNGEEALGTELLPMLHTNTNTESDNELSPTTPTKSFANPNYQTPPAINKPVEPKNESILPTSDNYINMPQHKLAMKNETEPNTESFTNPSYVHMNKNAINENNDKNYVNNHSRDWERPYL
ncbi:PDGF- and VEGF-receptor related [Carabus blaptoides fortunei]